MEYTCMHLIFSAGYLLYVSSSVARKTLGLPEARTRRCDAARVSTHEVSLLLFCVVWIGKRRLRHSTRKLQCCARVMGTEAKAKAKNTPQFSHFPALQIRWIALDHGPHRKPGAS